MTPRDIFLHLTGMIFILIGASFLGSLFAEAAFPGTSLAKLTTELFEISIAFTSGHVVLSVVLLSGWAVRQIVAEGRLFYTDFSRGALHHKAAGELDRYLSVETPSIDLPQPRPSQLAWLDNEIGEILSKGESNGPGATNGS